MKVNDIVMNARIREIIFDKRRPFTYTDFCKFKFQGIQYIMPYGTFRNKISLKKRAGTIVVAYKINKKVFYTLVGEPFTKPKRMTEYHMMDSVCHHPIFKELKNMRMDIPALHNIRLRFLSKRIWNIRLRFLSKRIWTKFSELGYKSGPLNNDVKLPIMVIDGRRITVTAHRSDTVSISIGCTDIPIAVDIFGIIRLSNALSIIQEHLLHIVSKCGIEKGQSMIQIPSCYEWIVTMWHFGMDSVSEYAGQKFECSWQTAQGILVRIYSKDFDSKKSRIRFEKQEYPKKKFAQVISEILFPNGLLI